MGNYQDLEVWKRAHRFTLGVYQVTELFPKSELFGLTSQIRRASSSIGANLAEGCGRRRDGELAHFVSIAAGSATELEYHLLLAKDLGYLAGSKHAELQAALEEIGRMLTGLEKSTRSNSRHLGAHVRSLRTSD